MEATEAAGPGGSGSGQEAETPDGRRETADESPTPDSGQDSETKQDASSSEPSFKGKEADETPVNEGFEADDLVEVGDDSFFYHPEEHGKDTGQGTTYKSRDAAEHGFANKAADIKDKLSKLGETELGVGPVALPEWVEKAIDDPDALDDYMNVDFAIRQKNGDLRKFVNEADSVITQLGNRQDQLHSKKQTTDNKQQIDELAQKAQENATTIRQDLNYTEDDLNSFDDVDALKADMQERIGEKIKKALKDDIDEYTQLLNADFERRTDDNYARDLDRKKEELLNKERELRDAESRKYFDSLQEMQQSLDEMNELQDGLEKSPEMSTKELQAKQETGYMDLQDFLANQPQDQQPEWFRASNLKGNKGFWNWAVDRASKFGNLTNGYYWRKAANAYGQHLKDMRAKIRHQQVEADNKAQEQKDKEMPGYGDQTKISPDSKGKKRGKRASMDQEMEALEMESERALG
jgi:hypothetical protein